MTNASHRRFFRFQAWACNALLVLSLIGARYHMARVSHGHCRRHGQLIHLERVDQKVEPRCTDRALHPSNHREDPHQCALLMFLSQCSTMISAIRSLAGEVSNPLPLLRPEQIPHLTIPLLRQSPKISPPPSLA